MAELQLEGLPAHRQAEDLMSQADAEGRHVRGDERLRVVDRVRERGRIARSVAQEDAVRVRRQQLRCRRGCREHADVAAVRAQPAQDVPLHAEVVGRDLQAPSL